ncbi:hypothetical protein HPB48_007306 [Haemaphysalis longicornis]|uniref:Uncharacterized protein n=1 Tax=Haemaphysalis longicornis TaxID=44386 RepID=A0A9J6GGK0_HAELO|nr:hypothetical protein HPB48_007306 [Haemaphysalis longicornis]
MGPAVLQATQHHGFVLYNDLTHPTMLGTSVARDTTPDLTFATKASNVLWTRLPDTLSSDH